MSLKTTALTTVARYKTYAGITTSSNDTLIENLINAVTEVIHNYIHRTVKSTTYTNEEYDGFGSDKLVLKNYPVTAFTRLQIRNGTFSENSWQDVSSDDYLVDMASGIITKPGLFNQGTKNYRVTYTAGYSYDNSSTFLSDTVAGDLEWVAWELIKKTYQQRSQEDGVQQTRLGDASITYKTMIFRDPVIKDILDNYKRVVV